MIITSELRATVLDRFKEGEPLDQELLVIADRIDAEHEETRKFCERLRQAAGSREDVTMFDVDYTALPADADGVPIHMDDLMDSVDKDGFRARRVVDISYRKDRPTFIAVDGDVFLWYAAEHLRHHTQDTWERIIKDAIRGDGGNYGCLEERFMATVPALVARCKALSGDAE